MDSRSITGLYPPLKDLWKLLARRRARGLDLKIEALGDDNNTRIVLTARCKPGGEPVLVRRLRAEFYQHAYDSCAEPEPVATKLISFLPAGPFTLRPGEESVQWESQVLNHALRQEVRAANLLATESVYGSRAAEVLAVQTEMEPRPHPRTRFGLLLDTLAGSEGVRVRVVLVTADNERLTTADVLVPPQGTLLERLAAAWRSRH